MRLFISWQNRLNTRSDQEIKFVLLLPEVACLSHSPSLTSTSERFFGVTLCIIDFI